MREIGYLDDPTPDYVNGLRKCETLDSLRAFAQEWADICPDALGAVDKLDEASFQTFRNGLLNHRRWGPERQTAWVTGFGPIPMPMLLLHVSLIADSWYVPWGCAFNRMLDVGQIKADGDKFTLHAALDAGKGE